MPTERRATLVITTKNRKEDLRGALASAVRQSVSLEIIVVDDGSTDGTADMVRSEFPTVHLVRAETSKGYIVQRNAAARLATTPVIVSIDDDAAFPSPDTIAQTLAEFDHPRVGAVAIPYINVNRDNAVQQLAPARDGVYMTAAYVGTAHAVRRDVFLSIGGYREFLFHQGEESEFCIRMMAAGYVVRLGNADPIHHFESPRRIHARIAIYGARNTILFAWYNVPMPFLLLHWVGTPIRYLRFFRPQLIGWHGKGIIRGYVDSLRQWTHRQPVPASIYRLHRRLRVSTARLEDVASIIPTINASVAPNHPESTS